MSTAVIVERVAEASPRPRARITGVVYLFYFLTAVLGALFLKGLAVDGDAAATANNILAHESLFRLGLATGLVATAFSGQHPGTRAVILAGVRTLAHRGCAPYRLGASHV